MAQDKITSIRLHESTKRRLREVGKMGDSYEQVILRLLEAVGHTNIPEKLK